MKFIESANEYFGRYDGYNPKTQFWSTVGRETQTQTQTNQSHLPQHWLARSVAFKSEVKTLSWNRGEVSSKVARESSTKSDEDNLDMTI